MGAPSSIHEHRVEALAALAELTGHTSSLSFPGLLRPDVAAFGGRSHAVFVADAKSTEVPSCLATRDRLAAYLDVCSAWSHAGSPVTMALAHSPAAERSWLDLLLRLATRGRLAASTAGVAVFAYDLSVSWIRVERPGRQRLFHPP